MASADMKDHVKARYGAIARQKVTLGGGCCGSPAPQEFISKRIGYADEELKSVPEGANLGLGCGNPLGLASVKPGATVLDLGSGAGIDCFLAAKKVGATGRVIGVDMTDDMLARARENAQKGGFTNVEFRKGEIEALPVEDSSVDVITSNCVINLSTDKRSVFAEAYRVLKPGGKAYISDIVLLKPLPEELASKVSAYVACVGGAMEKETYLDLMRDAGFSVKVTEEKNYPIDSFACGCNGESGLFEEFKDIPREVLADAATSVLSLKVELTK